MSSKPSSRRSSQTGPVAPTKRDARLAREATQQLTPYIKKGLRMRVWGVDGPEIELPAAAVRLLAELLIHLAEGSAATVVPTRTELTTLQAADFLGVSRPFLIKELDSEKVPYRMVGTHRRILLADLIRYRDAMDGQRHKALDELAKQAQELCIGY